MTSTPRVLLVDDETEVRLLVRLLLESCADVVGEAGDGVEAIATYEAGEQPDVVILDLRMPGMDGLEVAAAMLERTPQQQIVLFSSVITDELRGRAAALGIRACVNKEDFSELPQLVVDLTT